MEIKMFATRLRTGLSRVFNQNGVQIMSPHYMTDTSEPQAVAKERWNAPVKD